MPACIHARVVDVVYTSSRMRPAVFRFALALALPVALCFCQLFGGSTQVRFLNATSFTLAVIQFGSLVESNPLPPGPATSYFSVVPGTSSLTVESQSSQWSTPLLLPVVAGHSYTVTFTGTIFSRMAVVFSADN